MQLLLPIFPVGTTLLNEHLGVFINDGIVTYLHSGAPIFNHAVDKLNCFRFITSKLVVIKCCKQSEIVSCFKVSASSVSEWVKLLKKEGEEAFFRPENRQGHGYKLIGEALVDAQRLLDQGKSNCEIGRKLGVQEGAIRYALKTGKIVKKKAFPNQS